VAKYSASRKKGLVPYRPGQSGNPGGRPRRKPISDRYEYIAEIVLPEDVRLLVGLAPGATYADAAALQQFRAAIKGETTAIREIREAIEGKATIRVAEEDAPSGMVIEISAIPRKRELA
jgi:hypothetical protein